MRRVHILPATEKRVVNTLAESFTAELPRLSAYGQEGLSRIIPRSAVRCHPLIDAVHAAFSRHRPLTLSPDAVWLVIAQGFSHHIAENAETYRGRLVRHQGSRQLTASLEEWSVPGFARAISQFSTQIRDASDPVLHETLLCDFSTTTPDIRTASEVVLMDCYASYFEYMMMCVCGIPKITLQGQPADWQRIRERLQVLETFDLGWWVKRLRPIVDEFILTAQGQPNQEFWQAIYKPKQAYGATSVTGWIADLFPYLGEAPTRRRNHVFAWERQDWAVPIEQGVSTWRAFEQSPEPTKAWPWQAFLPAWRAYPQ